MLYSWYFMFVIFALYVEGATEKKCSETSCCADYMFDSSKKCVACPSGLHGVHCSAPCPRGQYGVFCAHKCECPNEFCNPAIGCVRIEECLPGYFGENCSTICPRGYYGNLCHHRCECPDELCNSTTGCVVCPRGYMGENCSTACPRGFYGNDCREPCNCSKEFCDATFGCTLGYGPNYIDPLTLPTIILSIAGLIFLCVPLGTLIVYKMRKNTNHQVMQTKNITSSAEYGKTYFDLVVPNNST